MTAYEESEYELERKKRIARNHAVMESLGLISIKDKLKGVTKKKKVPLKKLDLPSPGEERRSKRISKNPVSLIQLSYLEDDDSDKIVTQGEDEKVDLSLVTPRRAPKRRKITPDQPSLTAEQKKGLEGSIDGNYLTKFEEFLVEVDKISPQNVRNVMRQVRKLAHGEGVRYESAQYGWPEGCYVWKGKKVTPLSDIFQIMEEGQKAEDTWGRDHGNGWLLSHPLKKLLMFQQFVLENQGFLTAKCKLEDYRTLATP